MRFPEALAAAIEQIERGPQDITIREALYEIGVTSDESEALVAYLVEAEADPDRRLGYALYLGLMTGRHMAR